MSWAVSPDAIHNVSADDFTSSIVQLYSSPQVTIRIKDDQGNDKEYKLPKGLLCKQSPYFAAMFEGKFREGQEQSVIMPELEGVISVRSFETLIHYLYLGYIVHQKNTSAEEVNHIIEFMRLADMYGVTGMEEVIAARLKPSGNPVRRTIAEAAVHGYLQHEESHFWKQACREVPSFAVDLLEATQQAFSTFQNRSRDIHFQDPIDGIASVLNRNKCHCNCPSQNGAWNVGSWSERCVCDQDV